MLPAFLLLLRFVVLAGWGIGAHPALAADADKPGAVLVVDMQRILDQSEAAKSVQKQLGVQRARFQAETEKEENQLRQAEQDLNEAHDRLPAEAYAKREQKVRQHFVIVERHVDQRRKLLDQSFTDAMNVVHDKLLAIIQDAAREKNADLVLAKQQVLWADATLDATDEILARLNKDLPRVAIKMPDENKTE